MRVHAYDAFISYSHAKDRSIAAALQKVMQTLGKAWWQRRSLRIFRDETSLTATPELWPTIEAALTSSRFLLLMASPEAAHSEWVDKEVTTWLAHRGPEDGLRTLLIALTDGELSWDKRAGGFAQGRATPLPASLKNCLLVEPLWVDLRLYRSGAEHASKRNQDFALRAGKLAARVLGVPLEDLLSDEVRQQRRALTLAWSATGALMVLAALALWQQQVATVQRDRAQVTQVNVLVGMSTQQHEQANFVPAALLALQALPDADNDVPYVARAEAALYRALHNRLETHVLKGSMSTLSNLFLSNVLVGFPPFFAADDTRLGIVTSQGNLELWDTHTGQHLHPIKIESPDVRFVSFRPDRLQVVLGSSDGTALLWDLRAVRETFRLTGHLGPIVTAAYSPVSPEVITGSEDATARLWNVETGRLILVLHGHEAAIRHATFSGDGRVIATASDDNTARLWDARTGKELQTLRGHESHVAQLIVSPTGARVATMTVDRQVRLWDGESGSLVAFVGTARAASPYMSFTRDGKRLLMITQSQAAILIDVESGDQLGTLMHASGSGRDTTSRAPDPLATQPRATGPGHLDRLDAQLGIYEAIFSPDSRRIATTASDKSISLWGAVTGRHIAVLDHLKARQVDVGPRISVTQPIAARQKDVVRQLVSAFFNAAGMRLVTSASDHTARVWDAENGQLLFDLIGHTGVVRHAEFSTDGTGIVTASEDGTARLWDAADGSQIAVLRGHDGPVRYASFNSDNSQVVTASDDLTTRLWRVRKSAGVVALIGHSKMVTDAVFDPAGGRVLTTAKDRTARLWDIESGRELAVLAGHTADVRAATFDSAGKRVVTASDDHTTQIWNAVTGERLAVLVGHQGQVTGAAFIADGSRVVTTSVDRTARLWDAATGLLVAVLSHPFEQPHGAPQVPAPASPFAAPMAPPSDERGDASALPFGDVGPPDQESSLVPLPGANTTAALSANGRWILTTAPGSDPRIWDSHSGTLVSVLTGHESAVTDAAFSPDSAHVITASTDRTARLWSAESGRQIHVFKGHNDEITSAAFDHHGSRVVTASRDRSARIWDAATGLANMVLKLRPLPFDSRFRAEFNPSGNRVLIATTGPAVWVWDATSGKEIGLLGHAPPSASDHAVMQAMLNGITMGVRFAPEGTHVLTVGYDTAPRLWDTDTGMHVAILAGHTGIVWQAAFHHAGRYVVTASNDGTAHIWRVLPTTKALVDFAKHAVPRCLALGQYDGFYTQSGPPRWCIEKSKWPYHTQEWQTWLVEQGAGKRVPFPRSAPFGDLPQ